MVASMIWEITNFTPIPSIKANTIAKIEKNVLNAYTRVCKVAKISSEEKQKKLFEWEVSTIEAQNYYF